MSTSTNSTLQLGDVLLGKYRVERVLGQGGMGIVVAVRHEQLGELFAVKVMLPQVLAHPEAVERFLREARASARLRGEHVARVHDVGSLDNGAPYMLLEYLEGMSLGELLESRKTLGIGEAAGYVYQVCEALVEAHGHGIVHRDLKPPNLFLIRRPDGTPCVKVLDFGISKDVGGADKVSPQLTKTGAIMGSPHYMSPEQMTDSKTVDNRSDIWSLGIILYQLVTGTMPFDGDIMPEIIAKVLANEPVPPSQVRPGISSAFDVLVARCIDKNRDQRYQSVQEFMSALKPFVNDADETGAQRVQIVPPSTGSGNSNIGQSGVGWGQATIPAEAAGAANQPGRSPSRQWIGLAIVGLISAAGIVAFVTTRPSANESNGTPVPAASFPAMTSSTLPSADVAATPPPKASMAVVEPPPWQKATKRDAALVQTNVWVGPSGVGMRSIW